MDTRVPWTSFMKRPAGSNQGTTTCEGQPLEGLYKTKCTSVLSVTPKKKLQLETTTSHSPSMLVPTPEPNWSHAPVEIILMEPSEKEAAVANINEFLG